MRGRQLRSKLRRSRCRRPNRSCLRGAQVGGCCLPSHVLARRAPWHPACSHPSSMTWSDEVHVSRLRLGPTEKSTRRVRFGGDRSGAQHANSGALPIALVAAVLGSTLWWRKEGRKLRGRGSPLAWLEGALRRLLPTGSGGGGGSGGEADTRPRSRGSNWQQERPAALAAAAAMARLQVGKQGCSLPHAGHEAAAWRCADIFVQQRGHAPHRHKEPPSRRFLCWRACALISSAEPHRATMSALTLLSPPSHRAEQPVGSQQQLFAAQQGQEEEEKGQGQAVIGCRLGPQCERGWQLNLVSNSGVHTLMSAVCSGG